MDIAFIMLLVVAAIFLGIGLGAQTQGKRVEMKDDKVQRDLYIERGACEVVALLLKVEQERSAKLETELRDTKKALELAAGATMQTPEYWLSNVE